MPRPKPTNFRIVHTGKGPVRLAMDKAGNITEAKNMRTGDLLLVAEFEADKEKGKK